MVCRKLEGCGRQALWLSRDTEGLDLIDEMLKEGLQGHELWSMSSIQPHSL
jgi:hypothetical protein